MSKKKQKKLRSGFTTGACAAAAAKAATLVLLGGQEIDRVEIPFPTGERYGFSIHSCDYPDGQVWGSVIKDAGDDPDMTNGAEIVALVEKGKSETGKELITLVAGSGVGRVIKPGLPVPVG